MSKYYHKKTRIISLIVLQAFVAAQICVAAPADVLRQNQENPTHASALGDEILSQPDQNSQPSVPATSYSYSSSLENLKERISVLLYNFDNAVIWEAIYRGEPMPANEKLPDFSDFLREAGVDEEDIENYPEESATRSADPAKLARCLEERNAAVKELRQIVLHEYNGWLVFNELIETHAEYMREFDERHCVVPALYKLREAIIREVPVEIFVKYALNYQLIKDGYIRRLIIEAAGKVGPAAKEVVPALIKNALHDKSLDLRNAVVTSLGQIGDVRAIEPLMDIMEDKYFKEAARTAATALSQIALYVVNEQVTSRNKFLTSEIFFALRKSGFVKEAEKTRSRLRQVAVQYDTQLLSALPRSLAEVFEAMKLSETQARQLLEDIERNRYMIDSTEIPDLLERIDKCILRPDFLGGGQLGLELYMKIGEFLDWVLLPVRNFEEFHEQAAMLYYRYFEHGLLHKFYENYDIANTKDARLEAVEKLREGTYLHPRLRNALCWWVIEQESARRGNREVRQTALQGINESDELTAEDKNRLLLTTIADRSESVRRDALDILSQKTDYIDVYLLEKLYEMQVALTELVSRYGKDITAGSRLALQRWAVRLAKFRQSVSSHIGWFGDEKHIPYGVENKYRYNNQGRRQACLEAEKLKQHINYKIAHPELFGSQTELLLARRIEVISLRDDIKDKERPAYYARAMTQTIDENLHTAEQNPLTAKYHTLASPAERIEFIDDISLATDGQEEQRAQAVDFLTYLIVNWGWEVSSLTQAGLLAACNKLEQILNHGQADSALLTMFGHIKREEKEVSLSDEMAWHIAWNGVVEYYTTSGLRDRHPEGLEEAIEQAEESASVEESVSYQPTSQTAVVKLEDAYLVRPGAEGITAVARFKENIKRTKERIFGEAEDDDYYPPRFTTDLLSLKHKLGLRVSMAKEESMRLLRRSKRQLAARFQDSADTREQKYLIEQMQIINDLIKEVSQMPEPEIPQPSFIASKYPLVPYVKTEEAPQTSPLPNTTIQQTSADAKGKADVAAKLEEVKKARNGARMFAAVVGADKEERAEFAKKLSGCGFDGIAEGASVNEARQKLTIEYRLNIDDFILTINLIEDKLTNNLNEAWLLIPPPGADSNIYDTLQRYLKDVKTQA